MVLDGAGRHGGTTLGVPADLTLVASPPHSPERDPVERVWPFSRERLMSPRFFPDQAAIVDACCDAWNTLPTEGGRIKSLRFQPWIEKVIS